MLRGINEEIIIDAVANKLGITNSSIKDRGNRKGNDTTAKARQISAYLLRVHTDLTLQAIANLLGFKDKQYIHFCIDTVLTKVFYNEEQRILITEIEVDVFRGQLTMNITGKAPINKYSIDGEDDNG